MKRTLTKPDRVRREEAIRHLLSIGGTAKRKTSEKEFEEARCNALNDLLKGKRESADISELRGTLKTKKKFVRDRHDRF